MLKILELGSNFGFMRANVGYVQEICSGSGKSFVVVKPNFEEYGAKVDNLHNIIIYHGAAVLQTYNLASFNAQERKQIISTIVLSADKLYPGYDLVMQEGSLPMGLVKPYVTKVDYDSSNYSEDLRSSSHVLCATNYEQILENKPFTKTRKF